MQTLWQKCYGTLLSNIQTTALTPFWQKPNLEVSASFNKAAARIQMKVPPRMSRDEACNRTGRQHSSRKLPRRLVAVHRESSTWKWTTLIDFCGMRQVSKWSGRRDSNPRPSAPKADALPDCATPRRLLVYRIALDAAVTARRTARESPRRTLRGRDHRTPKPAEALAR